MVVDCYAAESAVNMVAGLVDQGYEDYAVEAAISKVFATEALWRTADEALQIAGGNGYMCEFPYERAMRDCRINRIFEGTNDILRLFIALTAMNDVGAQLKELVERACKGVFNDPIKGFGVLQRVRAPPRVAGHRHRAGRRALHPAAPGARSGRPRLFEEPTRDLATAADRMLRKHGKNIIGKQFATKRLADIMIDLFVFGLHAVARVDASMRRARRRQRDQGAGDSRACFAGQVRRRVKRNFAQDRRQRRRAHQVARRPRLRCRGGYSWDNLSG